MSEELDRAREQVAVGRDKRALKALWVVEEKARRQKQEAEGLLGVACAIRDRNDGRVRREAEDLVRLAQAHLGHFARDPDADASMGRLAPREVRARLDQLGIERRDRVGPGTVINEPVLMWLWNASAAYDNGVAAEIYDQAGKLRGRVEHHTPRDSSSGSRSKRTWRISMREIELDIAQTGEEPFLRVRVHHPEVAVGQLVTAFTPEGAEIGIIVHADAWHDEPRTAIGKRVESEWWKLNRATFGAYEGPILWMAPPVSPPLAVLDRAHARVGQISYSGLRREHCHVVETDPGAATELRLLISAAAAAAFYHRLLEPHSDRE